VPPASIPKAAIGLLVDLIPAPQILWCSTVCSATTYSGPMTSAEHAECGMTGCFT
jgi:hypothetical protein